jgi:hypothetical protein
LNCYKEHKLRQNRRNKIHDFYASRCQKSGMTVWAGKHPRKKASIFGKSVWRRKAVLSGR